MSNYQAYPPIIEVPIFDILNYRYYDQAATIADLMKYLPLTGGSINGNLFVNGLLSVNNSSLLIGSTIMSSTATELNYLSGVTLGTVTASKALTANSGGTITFLNTNDSILINNTSSSGRSDIKFQNDISTSWEIGLRGSTTGSYPNSLYFYSGGYRLILNNSGDMQVLSTTASSSTTTGALTVSGGVGIVGNSNIGGNLYVNGTMNCLSNLNVTSASSLSSTLTVSGQCYFNNTINSNYGILNNVKTIYLSSSYLVGGFINVDDTAKIITTQSPAVSSVYSVVNQNQYGLFINRNGFNPGGVCNSNALIDFGAESHSCQINLYNGTYFITAADNATQIMSGGTNGILFGKGSGYTASSYDMQLTTNGSLTVGNSIRATGFNVTGFSGSGIEMHFSGYGQIYVYNRSSLLYRDLMLGNSKLYLSANGGVAVGLGATVTSFVLEVGSNTQTIGSYYYYNSGGSTGTSGGTTASYSAYFQGRLLANQELDLFSDRSRKSEIRDVSDDEAILYSKIKAKHYIFNDGSTQKPQYGFIAQDVLHLGIKNIVNLAPCVGEKEYHDEETGIVRPENTIFTISYEKAIPLQLKYTQLLEEEIKKNKEDIKNIEKKLEDITKQLSNMSTVDVKVNNDLSGLHDLLKDLKLKN